MVANCACVSESLHWQIQIFNCSSQVWRLSSRRAMGVCMHVYDLTQAAAEYHSSWRSDFRISWLLRSRALQLQHCSRLSSFWSRVWQMLHHSHYLLRSGTERVNLHCDMRTLSLINCTVCCDRLVFQMKKYQGFRGNRNLAQIKHIHNFPCVNTEFGEARPAFYELFTLLSVFDPGGLMFCIRTIHADTVPILICHNKCSFHC